MRLHFLFAFLALTSFTSAALPEKPNFIIINIDDLGYADIGPYGSKLNRTPHLDRMAAEGMKLTSHYAAPVCSPSRAALMTGCDAKRALPIGHVLFPASAVGVEPKDATIADVLKTAGYSTACVGKWHLGDQPEFLPTSQGFDYYLGIPYSNDMGTAEDGSKSDLDAPIPPAKGKAGQASDELGIRGNAQPPLPLLENDKVLARVRQEEQQGIVERYTMAAVKYIREQRDKPFFLYLPHNAVHFPLYPGKAFAGKSKHGYYSDWVEEVDWSVGQVLDTLRELKLDSRTMVVFTSDNGGTPRGFNTPLRGHKGSTWEGGIRVVTLAWWPGQIPAASKTGAITSMFDFFPTFAQLAGVAVPAAKIDGADIWPLLAGGEAKGPHDTFYYFRGLDLEAVRHQQWKLHLGVKGSGAGKGKGSPRAPELYDLSTDAAESQNVIAEHPGVVKQLQALVETIDSDLGKTGVGPGCRALGRVAEPKVWIKD